ncbi:hypothetical protein [Glutamicibacter sp. JC586]|uniref:hypothetical protein n=1 Tax=Glutamicibacter sp. JC586 TaxID=2590552 RepID=UPI00135CAABE|nr:hypothetical protein [Glutamicibacter sp. JC586]
MSDNSQPVSSRRALREKRRAEMEALLASSKAEQEAKELADQKDTGKSEKSAKPANTDSGSAQKLSPKPAPAKPQAPAGDAKPVAEKKVSTTESKPAQKSAPKSSTPVVPAEAKPTATGANKPAQNPAPKQGAPSTQADAQAAKSAPANKAAQKPESAVAPKPKVVAPQKPAQSSVTEAKNQVAPKQQPGAKADQPSQETKSEESTGERASLRRARNREALRERRRLEGEVDALTTHIPTVDPGDDPKPLTRRQLRLQALADQGKSGTPAASAPKPVAKPQKKQADQDDSPATTVMSVEQALAARRAHAPKAAIDPNLIGEDDSEIDLEVLAHQREMAARAAIISRRAAERERLRVENAKRGKDDKSSDPFTGAMGNIREVEDRIAKTGVQGPKTQSVSLNLDPDGKISSKKDHAAPAAKKPAAKPTATAKPGPKQTPMPAPKAAGKPAAKPAAKVASDVAPKPVAKTTGQPAASQSKPEAASDASAVEMPRINAVNAQGLEPLDVQTHGVRRANNMLIAMIVALSLGGAALIAGLIMLLGN